MMASIQVSIPKGKTRSPWMGVPIPGDRPLVLLTDHVRSILTGVTITDAAIVDVHPVVGSYMSDGRDNCRTIRALEVTYKHGKRGRGRAVFYDRCATKDDQKILWWSKVCKWAEAQRDKRAKPKAPTGKLGEIVKQIKRLEKERSGLYLSKCPPVHPLIPSTAERWDRPCRNSELSWHNEKPQRKAMARIAGMVLENKITATTGYKMLREMGLDFVKFSEQPTRRGRKECDTQDEYWQHLPKFVRGMVSSVARPTDYEWEDGSNTFTRHAEARTKYLATKRQAQTIDNQIAALREMAVPPLVLTEPPPTNWENVRELAIN